jgi:O-antigen ligase
VAFVIGDDRLVGYFRWATLLTAILYSAGYSSVGFGLLLLGTAWMVATRRAFPWYPTHLDLPLGAFGFVLVIAALQSPYRPVALAVTLMLLLSGSVYLGVFLWTFTRRPDLRPEVLRAWSLGAALAALVGLVGSVTSHARAEIPHGVGPNGLGTTLALGGVTSLGLGFFSRGWERAAWYGIGFVTLVGLLATGSRASLIGWVAGAVYLAWQRLGSQPRRLVTALGLGAVALLAAGVLAPQLPARIPSAMADISSNRIRIWQTSLLMIRASPWFGTGFGTFQTAYERWKTPGMSAEPFAFNLWLNVAVETGLAGLACGFWVALRVIRIWSARSERTPIGSTLLRTAVPGLWIALLVDELFDNTVFSISTSAALWLLIALTVTPENLQGSHWAERMKGL